jgi:hypothetical protein
MLRLLIEEKVFGELPWKLFGKSDSKNDHFVIHEL